MESIYELIQTYGKGKGESKMWESTKVISEYLDPMKEKDRHGYWCMMRRVYGVMSEGHYNEEFARYDVNGMEYTNREGKKKSGEYWSVEQVEEATKSLQFPSGVNQWDKYVAFNAMYSDLCRKMDDSTILNVAYLFYFADEDWPSPGTKIWDYFCMKNRLKK